MSRARPGKLPCGHDKFVDAPGDYHDDNANQVACQPCFMQQREDIGRLMETLGALDNYIAEMATRVAGQERGLLPDKRLGVAFRLRADLNAKYPKGDD